MPGGDTDYPSRRLTRQDKERFVAALMRARGSKRSAREAVRELGLKCRGLLGTSYAMATSSVIL